MQQACTRKRKRKAPWDDSRIVYTAPGERPLKKRNLSTKRHLPGFWDQLSTYHLTRRALQELNRRNSLPSNSVPRFVPVQNNLPTDIQRFARQGGPDLSDVVGYPEPSSQSISPMSTSGGPSKTKVNPKRKTTTKALATPKPKPKARAKTRLKRASKDAVTILTQPSGITKTKTKTDTTKTSSAYNNDFMQILINNCINLDLGDNEPDNINVLRSRLDHRRASLSSDSFPDDKPKNFVKDVGKATTEPKVMSTVFPTIIGKASYHSDMDRPCLNWAPLVEENLVSAKPDYFEGKAPGPDDIIIRRELHPFIVPSEVYGTPFLPNFFVEAKADIGSLAVGKRQALYDGTLGARGMHKVQTYLKEGKTVIFDKNAYTISATYLDGFLNMYTHHLSPRDGSGIRPQYYMTSIGSWSLLGSPRTFREAVSALRNARDLAYEFREQFLADANRRIAERSTTDETGRDTTINIHTDGPANTIQEAEVYYEASTNLATDEATSSPSVDIQAQDHPKSSESTLATLRRMLNPWKAAVN